MREYMGIVIDEKRPALGAALLAQAASVERDVCFGYDVQQHTMTDVMPSEHGQVIVTWTTARLVERTDAAQAAERTGR